MQLSVPNRLILTLTRPDGLVHVPDDDVSHSSGDCTAAIKAAGSEKTAQGTLLLVSYAQVGARCQDGSFSDSEAGIDGSLRGVANWRNRMKERAVAAGKAAFTPLRRFRRTSRDASSSISQTVKRSDMMAARKGGDGTTYRLMMISAHGNAALAPSSPQMHSMFFQRSREYMQHHFLSNDASDIVFGNSYPIDGSTRVSILTLGVKLRGGQTSWRAFVEEQKDNGKTIKTLVEDGIWMFASNKYIAAYFEVLDPRGLPIFDFMIYGFDSVNSPLPSK
ncbi:hypothetical protein DRE_05206 [Drechslerella stenobrocha 248]|uniref:Uncharacterized protein n=1 Tax=Drechslerella stenobrocha 248 TaxID=1043628 RepID=W7I9C9_9PEZI|nr:hypothetical protein DRE_05206 [Drechslerella stenobrocha 248]